MNKLIITMLAIAGCGGGAPKGPVGPGAPPPPPPKIEKSQDITTAPPKAEPKVSAPFTKPAANTLPVP